MELINSTPVSASVAVTGDVENAPRTAIVTAKATFRIEPEGQVELDRDAPFAIFDDDQPTELGLLPRDNLPSVDPTFEVVLLGRAHAPGGEPVQEMRVSVSVGDVRRELDIIGDRRWEGEGDEARPSRPEPFHEMPLVLERAFGGRAEVLIDVDSTIEVADPINPDGKGFNHIEQARQIGELMKAPEGFPRYTSTRELPNLEDPGNRIREWQDSQLPACWSTPPLHSGMIVERLQRKHAADPDRVITLGEPEMLYRAHPDWVIDPPPPASGVVLEGLAEEGTLTFGLPELKVVCDLRMGEEGSTVELVPKMLVLLPEERKFYIVYRQFFQFSYDADEMRVIRIREEQGWTQPARAKQ